MHDVVKTGGQLLLATLILIIITWAGEGGRARRDFKLFTEVNNGARFLPQKQKLFPTFFGFLPELTVMASTNCSLQLFVPITRARLVFFRSLSTVLWKTAGPANHQTMKSLKVTTQITFLLILWHIIPSVWSQIRWSIWELIVCFRFVRDNPWRGVHYQGSLDNNSCLCRVH